MKIKVITTDDGKIVGTIREPSASEKSRGDKEMRAEIVPMPGQRMQEIEISDEHGRTKDPDELHRHVKTYLSKRE